MWQRRQQPMRAVGGRLSLCVFLSNSNMFFVTHSNVCALSQQQEPASIGSITGCCYVLVWLCLALVEATRASFCTVSVYIYKQVVTLEVFPPFLFAVVQGGGGRALYCPTFFVHCFAVFFCTSPPCGLQFRCNGRQSQYSFRGGLWRGSVYARVRD